VRKQIAHTLVSFITTVFPAETAYGIADRLAKPFLRGKDRRLREDMRSLFPDKSAEWIEDKVHRQRTQRAWLVLDKLVFPKVGAAEIARRSDPASIAELRRVLDEALAEGNGAILYTIHYGRPLTILYLLAHFGYPIIGVRAGKAENETNVEGREQITAAGVEIMEVANNAASGIKVVRALKQNKILLVLPDGRNASALTMVEMLGQKVPIALGFAKLARQTGAALIATVISSDGPLAFRYSVERVELPEEDLPPAEVGRRLMEPVVRGALEDVGQWHGINRLMREARRAREDAEADEI
jgi:lauroyl/myristoyl acyltransferase